MTVFWATSADINKRGTVYCIANLAVCEDLEVGSGSGKAQLHQLLLKCGVHVHSICLLTLSLQKSMSSSLHG